MAINTTLEALSDQAFGAATAAYTLGLICSAVEFASRRSAARAAEPALVGAGVLTRDGTPGGVPIVPTAGPTVPRATRSDEFGHVSTASGPRAPWGERFGAVALLVTVVGWLIQVVSIVLRGFSAGRLPLGNMYEFTSVICATVVGAWLAVKLRNRALAVGVFVLLPVTLLMYVNGAILHVPAAELQAALNSYWKWIHVTTVSLSSGVLLFSGIASAVYLLRSRYERGPRRPDSIWAKLPELAVLDRVAYRTAVLAFPVYTFAVVTGALWAEVAWVVTGTGTRRRPAPSSPG